jgi:flagellar biosynthesis protein FliR
MPGSRACCGRSRASSALIAAAPLFGNSRRAGQVKLTLGVLLALIVAPTVPAVPPSIRCPGRPPDPGAGNAVGWRWVSMRLVFAAIEIAGEVASSTMGLGFATFFDPTTQGRSSAISQFLSLVATMAFLAVNAHLVLLRRWWKVFHAADLGHADAVASSWRRSSAPGWLSRLGAAAIFSRRRCRFGMPIFRCRRHAPVPHQRSRWAS